MRFLGFIGPSYTLQSYNVDCQRCINLYPEADEMGTGKDGEVASLVGTPGLRLLCTLPSSPVRGAYRDSKGQLWAVGGNKLYKISSSWGFAEIGTLNTSQGPVSFADNGLQVVVVDGPFGYYYDIATSVFSQITDANFLGSDQVSFIDGYFIFNKPNSSEFYISPINAVVPLSGLDIGSAEALPDNLIGHVTTQENLYLFGAMSVEIFYDSGNNSFPFERIPGSVMECGCIAAFSIFKLQETVYWLGQDETGRGIVYRAQGLQKQRISTYAIETEIAKLGDLSGARAWGYSQGGHSFYCLNLPGANTTWVFDNTMNLWHERAYLSSGQYTRHLADCHAFAYDTNVVGDYSNGNLYALDAAVFTDNGNPISRERSAPHISKDLNYVFHSAIQLDMETGVGTIGVGQGTDPQAMIQWSNDFGNTWSNEKWASIGKIGQRLKRLIWRRLGAARDRVYRFRITDPVKITLLGAEIDIEEGSA